MRDIDPHWQSTEPTVIGGAAQIKPKRRKASRRPAAIVGVLVVTLGVAAYARFSPLTAEVQESGIGDSASSKPTDSITVAITSAGLQPRSVAMRPGQTIVWKNETDLPHIFESNDIKDHTDQTMYSPAIFPGTEQSFTLSSKQMPGTYTYASVTASDIAGEVEVTAVALQTGTSSSSGMSDSDFFPTATTVGASSSADAAAAQRQSSASSRAAVPVSNDPLLAGFTLSASEPADVYAPPPEDNGLVPTNPYSIGSTNTAPAAASTSSRRSSVPKTNTHAAAPLVKPKSQPQTGSNGWMIALVGATVVVTGYLLMPRKKKF